MTNTTESLAELYYTKLRTSTNPGVTLAQFYSALFGKEVGRSEIIKFNMLLRVFGKYTVFFAIIDISRNESFPEFPYGLLHKVCKDRLENSLHTEITLSSFDSLSRMITEVQKDIEKVKKIDVDKAMKYLKDDE